MLAEIEWKLNHRPRKSLGYRTSLEYCKQLFNFDFLKCVALLIRIHGWPLRLTMQIIFTAYEIEQQFSPSVIHADYNAILLQRRYAYWHCLEESV